MDANDNLITEIGAKRIVSIDRPNCKITLSGATVTASQLPEGSYITVQNSFDNEITGLKAIFDPNVTKLYGLEKSQNSWMQPYVLENAGEIDEITLQTALDTIEENSGSGVNFIVCSWGVRRALQKLFAKNNRNVDVMELAGGYKAMSYNGIPVVADRFCPKGTMYMLNTDDFTLHQLCDWQWLAGEDGKILKQVAGKPVYTATLVKYADLICARPNGQGMISGITEA